jgi:hypothetical protein
VHNATIGSIFSQSNLRVSTDGGSTFLSTNYVTETVANAVGSTTASRTDTATNNSFCLSPNGDVVDVICDFFMDSSKITFSVSGMNEQVAGGVFNRIIGAGQRDLSALPTDIRILDSGGNITSGTFTLYGYKESV